ncbi:signal recognition particle receptor FtsY-like isoform X2 [Triticum dicoccoides]|uniref:signal recognition particle receptor FtsY-like isoform X2 n=1 Tax=Triticum dicoccoides TaxID=85692 RepID=UPI001891D978|nr:signal recognition particle receptor FtsY-like isoform X2 [Triticum dicoccoides]
MHERRPPFLLLPPWLAAHPQEPPPLSRAPHSGIKVSRAGRGHIAGSKEQRKVVSAVPCIEEEHRCSGIASSCQEILLVLHGTTGLNMLQQAKEFNDVVGIKGFILTKLDGTARVGCVVSVHTRTWSSSQVCWHRRRGGRSPTF